MLTQHGGHCGFVGPPPATTTATGPKTASWNSSRTFSAIRLSGDASSVNAFRRSRTRRRRYLLRKTARHAGKAALPRHVGGTAGPTAFGDGVRDLSPAAQFAMECGTLRSRWRAGLSAFAMECGTLAAPLSGRSREPRSHPRRVSPCRKAVRGSYSLVRRGDYGHLPSTVGDWPAPPVIPPPPRITRTEVAARNRREQLSVRTRRHGSYASRLAPRPARSRASPSWPESSSRGVGAGRGADSVWR